MGRNWQILASWQSLLNQVAGLFGQPLLLASVALLLLSIVCVSPSWSLPSVQTVKTSVLAPPSPPVTADTLWMRYNEDGLGAYKQGNLTQAADSFRAAYKAANKFSENDLRLSVIYTNLAAVYRDMGKYPASKLLFERAMKIKQATLASSDPSLLGTMKNYSALLRKMGLEDDATMLDARIDILAQNNKAKIPMVNIDNTDGVGDAALISLLPDPPMIEAKHDPWLVSAQDWINEPLDVIIPPRNVPVELPPTEGGANINLNPSRMINPQTMLGPMFPTTLMQSQGMGMHFGQSFAAYGGRGTHFGSGAHFSRR